MPKKLRETPTANHIAEVDTATGALTPTFAHNASNDVNTLENVIGNIIAGGIFLQINGLNRTRLASLDPTTGVPTSYLTLSATSGPTSWNPTRALGYGADDLLSTSDGLWVASDIFKDGWAQKCGGLPKHGGICFFPN